MLQAILTLNLKEYFNPSDSKIDGTACDVADSCDLLISICISPRSGPRYSPL